MPALPTHLSRRERQIMDAVYRRGRATAAEIHGDLPDPPVAAAVRTLLRILEEKGHLRHEKEGRAYRYYAVADAETAMSGTGGAERRRIVAPGGADGPRLADGCHNGRR